MFTSRRSLNTIPWVEKYRPTSLNKIAAHQEIIETIKKLVELNQLPHLLFYGPPGTGKTSTILAIVNQIFGRKVQNMVLDLNASDDRGINIVRQEIQDFASSKHNFGTYPKLIILDECDSMTKDAQFALRRVIEKFTKNARFCLICNYVSKIIPALQSRCTQFRFAPINEGHIRITLTKIMEQENITATTSGLDAVIRLGRGDMRRTLNIIQSVNMACTTITEDIVYDCMGIPNPNIIKSIIDLLFKASFHECIKNITEIQSTKRFLLMDVVSELQPYIVKSNTLDTVKIALLEAISDVEYMLSVGSNERLQLASLVGSFILNR